MPETFIPNLEIDGDDAHPAYSEHQFGDGPHEDDVCTIYEDDLGMFDDPVPGTVDFEDAKEDAGVMCTNAVSALLRAKMYAVNTGDKKFEKAVSDQLLEDVLDPIELCGIYLRGNERTREIAGYRLSCLKYEHVLDVLHQLGKVSTALRKAVDFLQAA